MNLKNFLEEYVTKHRRKDAINDFEEIVGTMLNEKINDSNLINPDRVVRLLQKHKYAVMYDVFGNIVIYKKKFFGELVYVQQYSKRLYKYYSIWNGTTEPSYHAIVKKEVDE